MNNFNIVRTFLGFISIQLCLALAPASGSAQEQHLTTEVTLKLEYFLYDLLADCRPGFSYPKQYVEWSMVQGSILAWDRTPILTASDYSIADPRRPSQSCDPWAIGPGGDSWLKVAGDITLRGTFKSNGGPITVQISMYDDDGDDLLDTTDDHLDLTRPGGNDVVFTIDPDKKTWQAQPGEPFCNVPDPGCTDNEGQWCGACNAAQACCDTGYAGLHRGYAFRGDGHGAGASWSLTMVRRECTARRDVDSDRDGLLDDWETRGLDRDCDGTVDVPFHTYGANPLHKDLFLEYDACAGEPISKQSILNMKAAFNEAPFDATGFPNPDGQPGIKVWVDTGGMIDPTADEGVGTCSDGVDNDFDLRMDAADPDCVTGRQESAGSCSDRIDNDNNGQRDMGGTCLGVDANNAAIPQVEGRRGSCADGVDNDKDNVKDGLDPDCLVGDNLGGGNVTTKCPAWGVPGINDTFLWLKGQEFSPKRHGTFRWVLRAPEAGGQAVEDITVNGCRDGRDNYITNGVADGNDPACQLAREDGLVGFGVGDCQNGGDDDGDLRPDALDPQCRLIPELPSTDPLSCWDGIDNGDGADRDDPDCKQWGGYNDGFDNIVILMEDQAGVSLMHELGHSMGLAHGGFEVTNFKPTYVSLMNYLYNGGIPQDRDAMAEGVGSLSEDGAGPRSCIDQRDNGNDGLIDQLDPDCRRSCADGVDNDRDMVTDLLDPDCRGIDLENDGIADFRQLDFSPQRMGPGARSTLSPPMWELLMVERDAFGDLDTNGDGRQDQWGDALNQIVFQRWFPGNAEGPGAGGNSCSDGADNDNNGSRDQYDWQNCRGLPVSVPRTGERMPLPTVPPTFTTLPVGFDWNGDNDVGDILTLDMDNDPEVVNDDPAALVDHDDWRNVRMLAAVRNAPGPTPPPEDREPTMPEIIEAVRNQRPADLVLEAATTRLVPGADGSMTLAIEVENVEPTQAFGPVTITLQGMPAGATATAAGALCWPEQGDTVCLRESLGGRQTWPITFTLRSELCSWRTGTITATVRHSGGVELNPEDNTLEIEVGGGGVWSQWRQCPSHWGASNYSGPSKLGTPTAIWTGSAILNTPVIDDAGDIYLADSGRNVRKIGPNGASRWTQPFSSVVRAGPALTPVGTIVVATEDGRVRGLSQATGAELWSYQIPTNVLSSLVIAGDRLYAVTQFGLGLADSVFALDLHGNFLWSRQLSGPLVSAPTVGANGTIYASVASGLFYSPAALTAVSPSGNVLWSKQLDGDARDTPVQRNGRVYVGTSTRRVYAFDAITGAQAWMYTTPCLALEACEISGPPVALPNNQLAVGSAGGRVHVIRDNGTSATLLRSIAASGLFLGGPRDSMVVGSNGFAYVGNRNAQMRLLNLQAGTQVSLVAMQGNAVGSVALDGQGRLYVGTDRGYLYRY